MPTLVALVVTSTVINACKEQPFQNIRFEEAQAAARRDGKPLLVVFTADWSLGCEVMNMDVEYDEQMREWIAHKAISIRLDVDQNRDLAARSQVTSFPTSILYKP